VSQKDRTAAAATTTTATATTAAASGADHHVEGESDDDQSRSIDNDYMGRSKRYECSDRTGGRCSSSNG
jgi:hypothetical protein